MRLVHVVWLHRPGGKNIAVIPQLRARGNLLLTQGAQRVHQTTLLPSSQVIDAIRDFAG